MVGNAGLQNKHMLVAGAARGIGAAVAWRLAEAGALLSLCDMNTVTLKSTSEALGERLGGNKVFAKVIDVGKPDEVEQWVKDSVAAFGKIDGCVNNAAIFPEPQLIADTSFEAWDRFMNVNLRGVFSCLKYQLGDIVDGESIVNVASAANIYGGPMISPYIAVKHAVVGLSKAAAYEYAARGIRVNAVCPGWTDTVLAQEFIESLNGLITADTVPQLFKRLAEPDDVASMIVFLLSEDSRFAIKGAFSIDGGYIA